MMITDSLVIDGGTAVFDHNGSNLIVGSSFTDDGGLVTANGGLLVMQLFGWLNLNGSADFSGGPTEGLITDGVMYVHGDFYAENGAFQASGGHVTIFEQMPRAITLSMPTSGAGSGADHFNDLQLSTQNAINVTSDIYVIGDVDDFFDGTSTTELFGDAGVSLFADGLQLGNGIAFNNLTLVLDDDINPLRSVDPQFDNAIFRDYSLVNATRFQIRHAGVSRTYQFNDIDFGSSASDAGAYVHAIDSDGPTPAALDMLFFYPSVTIPADAGDPARTIVENGAQVDYQ
jgi:hypothetical protein